MSVGKEYLKPIREALGRFFQLSDKRNEYFLIGIGNRPKLLQDWTSDTESLLKLIEPARTAEATALYDACRVAIEKVVRGQHQKHVLILIGDGADTLSNSNYADLKLSIEGSDVLLYSISSMNLSSRDGTTLNVGGQNVLYELSSLTGGVVFIPNGAQQTNSVFEMLAIELRNQYSLRFTPTATDGKRHSLKITVTPPSDAAREMQNLIVRSRKSFYAKAGQP